jgi:hypothetical protein
LLGAPSGTKWKKNGKDHEYGKVVSIETSGPDSPLQSSYPNRPGDDSKKKRQGLQPDQTYTITFRLMPWVPEPEQHLMALWAVLWTGLCFGAIGIRSRRGYGGLTPTEIEILPAPSQNQEGSPLPLFSSFPTGKQALAKQLSDGFATAQDWVREWIQGQVANELTLAPDPQPGEDPFQIAGVSQIFIGEAKNGGIAPWEAVMQPFMQASSDALKKKPDDHQRIIGSANPRLASPVWLRIFKTGVGYVPVITLGSSKTFNGRVIPKDIVQTLLTSVGAKPISEIVQGAPPKGATP